MGTDRENIISIKNYFLLNDVLLKILLLKLSLEVYQEERNCILFTHLSFAEKFIICTSGVGE